MSDDIKLLESLKLKNEVFRAKVREEDIPKYYIGPLHFAVNASLLLFSFIFCCLKIQGPSYIELSPFVLVLFFGNLVVYLIHKYPLHGRYAWNSYAYKNHTKIHHVFYTHNNVTLASRRDWYTMFFPAEIVLAFVLIYLPTMYFALKFIIGINATFAFLAASSMYFILYEIVHYCSHLPSNHFLIKVPFFKLMRRHHQIHHDPSLMRQANFCIVHPLFDLLLGTYINDEKYQTLMNRAAPGNGDGQQLTNT